MTSNPTTPEQFFTGHPLGLAALQRVTAQLGPDFPLEMRVSRSQVALRRARGFAYLWLPGQYLASPGADVVLSIVLGRHDPSPRFKEVVHPAPTHWMHHLELHDVDDVDDEVADWLREAAERAG